LHFGQKPNADNPDQNVNWILNFHVYFSVIEDWIGSSLTLRSQAAPRCPLFGFSCAKVAQTGSAGLRKSVSQRRSGPCGLLTLPKISETAG
jgi:hypothetical protein